jgi:UDP-2,3-diacylglucosamine pyrophosphatase LpxH
MPAPDLPRNLLIVSDLHLSEGRHAATKKFSPQEDFFFDEEFARFLAYYQKAQAPGSWHLIINGDFLDLLQVTSLQGAPAGLSRDPRHPEYGAGCGEQETVFKLGKIVQGHPRFFAALAEFVAAGNLLSIIKGNHDVEFHFPAVRAGLIAHLRAACQDQFTPSHMKNISAETVLFPDWFYYEKDCLWVEHGNQYDGLNTFRYWLSPLLPELRRWPQARKDEIDLPWGSLFVRYLFNKIEGLEPFADNIKPQTRFLRWLLRKHPITALRFASGDGGYMLEKVRRAWAPVPEHAYDKRRQQHEERLQQLARQWGISPSDLRDVYAMSAPSVLKQPKGFRWRVLRALVRYRLLRPLLFAGVGLIIVAGLLAFWPFAVAFLPDQIRAVLMDAWVFSDAGRTAIFILQLLALIPVVCAAVMFFSWLLTPEAARRPGSLKPVAQKIARRLNVQYLVMGHTHDPDLQRLGEGREYFNTGTWTRVFSERERLLREDVEFTFLEGMRKEGTLRFKLMRWDDAAEEPRLLPLLEDEELTQPRKPQPLAKAAAQAAD